MKARLLTSAVGVPLVVVLLILGEYFPWVMYLAISVLCSLMTYELLTAKKLHKNLAVMLPSVIFAFVQPLLVVTQYKLIPVFLFGILLLFGMIVKSETLSFSDVSFALTGTIMIVFGMSSILMISSLLGGYISFAFVLTIAVAWLSDAGAFFAGVSLGKHKLCPKVSPNKTVEGFVGGLVAGTLSSALIGFVYSFIYSGVTFNYLTLVVISLFGSLVSVLGDLTFSQIKRSCKIKDYGSIFPGHGGMLDRFDSVIFISPLVYLFCLYFPVINV